MENNMVYDLLKEFLSKTRERKIPWAHINPNAVRWIKMSTPQPTTTILQKQIGSSVTAGAVTRVETYVFTVQTPPNTSVNITTTSDKNLLPILKELFDEASISASDKTVETLQNLLKGI